ncbi:hypothetical protein M378DRAFT_76310 [Amanita muscaria Koide BX008]|uniref:HIT-type domain-containing protein n=1 Tax=Amanita muscaria (strain Koide BX008) TaxID=946122 RepID=A0A0C2SR97_AMAMK|nr:hypothetical protein M378DRAFT_76310 [Amanita muscaria Koide BX008]
MTDCQICGTNQSKYTCSRCLVAFCSVSCYKHPNHAHHSESPSATERSTQPAANTNSNITDKSLRLLASLNWPYVPDESAYPDPLKRDDPKILQLHQYEAIATSATIRQILTSYPSLKDILTSIDKLRGQEREEALKTALGVTASDIDTQSRHADFGEDVLALRKFAEAVEAAVRGENQSALGLDWGDTLQ